MEMSEIVRRNIKFFRTQNKMSQEFLASLADLHRAYLGQIERGEKKIGIDRLQKIASALNLHISEFFVDRFNDDNRNSPNHT